MLLFDSHCHLDDSGVDPSAALAAMSLASVGRAVIAGYGPERHARARGLCERDSRLRRGVGLHPWWLGDQTVDQEAAWQAVEQEVRAVGVVAVGEIGVDRTRRKHASADTQLVGMRRGLRLAADCDLPVILHVVGWHGHALKALRACPPGRGGVVHRFGGSEALIADYTALGVMLSVDVIAFRRQPDKTLARAASIPLDHLLVETDWPERGVTYAESLSQLRALVVAIAAKIGLPVDDLAAQLWHNASRLYGLTPAPSAPPANAMNAK
jgi:TatD DNase family protein